MVTIFFIWIIRFRIRLKRKWCTIQIQKVSKIRILSNTGEVPCQRRSSVNQRWAWTRSGFDIIQDTSDFFGSGLDLDIHFWKILDQDIGLISITKFSWEWFKMSQTMVAVFSLLWFYIQYVLHSSQFVRRVILSLIFSGQVEVVSCFYIAGMLLCLSCWMAYVCVA